jgi:hypothetical protein
MSSLMLVSQVSGILCQPRQRVPRVNAKDFFGLFGGEIQKRGVVFWRPKKKTISGHE